MKRINEFKRNKIFILNSLNDYRFKLYFLIILILSIYCTSSVFKSNIFLETYYSFINSWVFLVLSFVFTIVTLDFCKKYSNKYSLMIRHKNKSTFIKKLIFPFFIICSSIFLIFLLLIFSLLIIKNGPLPHTFKFVYDLNISFYSIWFKHLIISTHFKNIFNKTPILSTYSVAKPFTWEIELGYNF